MAELYPCRYGTLVGLYVDRLSCNLDLRASLTSQKSSCPLTATLQPTVILIDDDRSIIRALRRLLVAASFKVLTFERPTEVLEAILPSANACLVVDVNLPEMNGAELCEALRASGCNLPIIAITGATDIATRNLIARLRAITGTVLYKPFERDTFVTALNDALKRARNP